MIRHVSIGTNGVARARSFYDAMMPILGLRPLDGSAVSTDHGPGAFLFGIETPVDGEPASVGNGSHIAFAAGRRAMVDRIYEVACSTAAVTPAHPDFARNQTATITPSCSIPTATRSKQ